MVVDQLSKAIAALLPPETAKDVKSNLDAVIRANFEKMQLVTRDELEIQQKVLQRTREKLERLERQVAELEQTQRGN
ncbi:MAG: accessory factor UbiK family protein [Pseudomonadota bacterium]|nr:accessory factor UbiK family protein [Pseudomonadota bacterium]